MTDFRWRPAVESDRPFINWMDELTETFGDEDKPLLPSYAETRQVYVNQWDEAQGGVVLVASSLDDADRVAFTDDIRRNDPFAPEFSRAEAFGAVTLDSRRVHKGGSSSSDCGECLEVPVGAAWLRRFTHEAPGYGFVADGIPEVALALRPGAVGRRLSQTLLAGLIQHARHLGYPGVSLAVHDDNPRAAKAYVKAGFERVGRSQFPDHDVMVMRF